MTERPDPFQQLQNLQPFTAGPGDSIEQQEAMLAMFEEVTMRTTTPSVRDRIQHQQIRRPSPPWWRRPGRAIPAVTGALAVIVAAVVAFSAISAPSALAAVTEAAERADAFRSGVVNVVVDVRQAEGLDEAFTAEAAYRYDGDDFSLVVHVPDSAQPVELLQVDGVDYARLDGAWFSSREPTSADFDTRTAVGFDVGSMDPGAVLTLIRAADDMSEVSSSGGLVTYRATVSSAALVALGSDGLPVGLGAVLSGLNPADELPAEMVLTIETTDGVLSSAAMDMAGDTAAAGYLEATIEATYTQLGLPQTITAPDPAEIQEVPTVDVEGLEEAAAIIGEVESRRPGLCKDVEDSYLFADPESFDPSVLPELVEAMAACYTDAGEPAAASAYRTLMSVVEEVG
jgi:hypothetical protein